MIKSKVVTHTEYLAVTVVAIKTETFNPIFQVLEQKILMYRNKEWRGDITGKVLRNMQCIALNLLCSLFMRKLASNFKYNLVHWQLFHAHVLNSCMPCLQCMKECEAMERCQQKLCWWENKRNGDIFVSESGPLSRSTKTLDFIMTENVSGHTPTYADIPLAFD